MTYFIKKNKGFTLIEILISLLILAGSTLIISRIGSGNQKRTIKINDYHTIVHLMETKIAELEFEWRKKNFDSIPKELKGEFETEKHFSWSVKTQKLNLSNPQQLMKLGDQQKDFSLKILKVISEFLSSAILETKLTIHYKKGIFKSAYSMTTYIVDHNKEVQLSLPTGHP